MKEHDADRRNFVKKALYVAPAILTLNAVSAVAKAGSGRVGKKEKNEKWHKKEKQDKRRGELKKSKLKERKREV